MAKDGEANLAQAPIASLSAAKWPGTLPSPEVLFSNDSIVDHPPPVQIPRSSGFETVWCGPGFLFRVGNCLAWGIAGDTQARWRRAAQFPISSLFHPKSRASIDSAPGPTSARAAPIAARRMPGYGFSWRTTVCQIANPITSDPAMGVHSPAISSAPSPIASRRSITDAAGSPV